MIKEFFTLSPEYMNSINDCKPSSNAKVLLYFKDINTYYIEDGFSGKSFWHKKGEYYPTHWIELKRG